MTGWKDEARRILPPPVMARIQAARGMLARAVAGTELFRLRQENDRLRDDLAAAVQRHGQDLLARSDAVLSAYDRRLAAIANRLLDLEARLSPRSGDDPTRPGEPDRHQVDDANRILAAHEEHPG